MVSAGFRTLVACFAFGDIEGAKLLGNMGFEPQGENLSLIMVQGGKGENKGRYIIENRIDALIDELNLDKKRITGVSHKSVVWNIKMMATIALLCALSIVPYIYINLRPNNLDLKRGMIWVFPILRSTGGFITAALIQLLIQQRITTISNQYLIKRDQQLPVGDGDSDIEAAAGVEKKKYQMDARTWLLLFLLIIGLLASVVGYVGCFSIVQNSASSLGPVSWLCLEVGLSIIRLAIWAWNPTTDDAPPLEINLELDNDEPLPTCYKYIEKIEEHDVLPLTRARDFLKSVTSFVGLIKPFSDPNLSLYYTLTRKLDHQSWLDRVKEWTLYITVFDHKERRTGVYTRYKGVDTFFSTKSDAPADVGHHLLEVEIGAEIDSKDDPVCGDGKNLASLREHHRSILEHIQYRLATGNISETYALENHWTMNAEDTDSMPLRSRNGIVERRRTEVSLLSDYLMHSSIETTICYVHETRVKWIARRMEMIAKETKERLLGMGVEYRFDGKAVEKVPATKSLEEIEEMLGHEHFCMELLLLYEAREWERLFWDKFETFLGNDRVQEKERLRREWRVNYRKRLNTQIDAALKRMANVDMKDKDRALKILDEQWALSISRNFEEVENPDILSLSKLRGEFGDEDMRLRMENEIEDIEFRLKRGSDLGQFDQFWDDEFVFDCRYSRSKWFRVIFNGNSIAPLEVYSHYLKGNKNIIHISFGDMNLTYDIDQFLSDIPWVTSISTVQSAPLPRDLLFIQSTWADMYNDLNTFAKEIKLDPPSTYFFSDTRGLIDVFSGELMNNARVLISFIPPTSGKCLTLRVKHRSENFDREDAPLEVTLGSSTKIRLNPFSKSESSLTIDDITLYPIQVPGPSDSDHLSFVPEVRNDIYIRFILAYEHQIHDHILHDIELLDEAGREYMPHLASLSNTV